MAKENKAKVHKLSNRGRRKMTIQERLDAFLGRQAGFVGLKAIYKFFRVDSTGSKAGIRGLLNKGCGRNGRYVRNKKVHGEYTLVA